MGTTDSISRVGLEKRFIESKSKGIFVFSKTYCIQYIFVWYTVFNNFEILKDDIKEA